MDRKKLISVVAPVFNESLNINELYSRIRGNFVSGRHDYEILFVDNASTDDTLITINDIIKRDTNVRCVLMSRNFGSAQPSLMAGIVAAKGDAIVTIDGDLQDPPETISEFIKKWEEGYQVVYGVRSKRQGPFIMKLGYLAFSVLFKKLSYMDFPIHSGDYGLVDAVVANEIRKLRETDIVYRGMRAWVGFKQVGVEYTRHDRKKGVSSSSFLRNIRWGIRWIINYSDKPLQWISNMAVVLMFLSVSSIGYYLFSHFSRTDLPTGTTTIVILLILFNSFQFLALSIIGFYIALIVREIKGRPSYIVKQVINEKEHE